MTLRGVTALLTPGFDVERRRRTCIRARWTRIIQNPDVDKREAAHATLSVRFGIPITVDLDRHERYEDVAQAASSHPLACVLRSIRASDDARRPSIVAGLLNL